MQKAVLFNPRSANAKHRIPNSILQIGAAIQGKKEYVIVDGNRELNPLATIKTYLETGEYRYFCATVMPGLQLKEAIPITSYIRQHYPEILIIWGGYFASNQAPIVMESGWVDVVVYGPGDYAFPQLLDVLDSLPAPIHTTMAKAYLSEKLKEIENLVYYNSQNELIKTRKNSTPDYDNLPDLPYAHLNQFYSLEGYLPKTFMGNKTFAYHSSFGCPFSCSFCGIVPIYQARWKGKSATNIFKDVKWMKENYGIDALEFHDNNFFVSEKRTVEFANLMVGEGIQWWGEARIDTMDKYKDESLAILRKSGCRMIFFGAETGNDDILKSIDKGGTQTGEQILKFAARMKKFDIIPEYSFVLGFPAPTAQAVMQQIDADIAFIQKVKTINPQTEIILYVYSPVPTEGSELFEQVKQAGFSFPKTLEDWLEPAWEKFDLRKNPLTPWLTPEMIDKIKDFETVLNGYYPTCSDVRLSPIQKSILRTVAAPRYRWGWHRFPYEIKVLHKIWKYRQPEIEGF